MVGDFITKEDTVGSEMYFIRKGNVEVMVGETVVTTLGEGSYFGGNYGLDFLRCVSEI